MSGFAWPGPDEPKCGAKAEDRATGEHYSCLLRRDHRDQPHHWEEIVRNKSWPHGNELPDQLRSLSWVSDGPVTFVGRAEA